MMTKIALILVSAFVCRVYSSCTDIPNEDKIDCVQHESWTVQSCLAKGCCHAEVPGFPACYYPFGNKHEARCAMNAGERRECGNAGTTEIGCIKSGCCWQMTPGAPFCYHAKEVVTDSSTTASTDTPETETTSSEVTTSSDGSTVTDNPSHDDKCEISTFDRKDCGDDKTTAIQCKNKGCCWQISPGAPYCFHKKGGDVTHVTDNPLTDSTKSEVTTTSSERSTVTDNPSNGDKCEIPTFDRKDCGDDKTTSTECKKKGCCWQTTPGAPFCYYKGH